MEATAEHTSVHTQETTGQTDLYVSYRTYRQSLCADEFTAVEQLYSATDELDETNRSKLLSRCRTWAWFVRDRESGIVHVASNSCRLRWCPICARAKAAYITNSVRPWIEQLQHPRFLTLTLKHSNAPLDTQISKLYDDFRKLRRDKQFKEYCTGGVWFFQVKLSDKYDQWHPHIHCVITGKYMPHEWISLKWQRITTSSNIVDIRMVRDPERMANEVAKYSARPAELKKYPMNLRQDIFYAMHKRRLCGTWGTGKEVKLCPPRTVEEEKYEPIGSWSMVTGLREEWPEARAIFEAWRDQTPLGPGIKLRSIDSFIDGLPQQLQSSIDSGKYDPMLDFQ